MRSGHRSTGQGSLWGAFGDTGGEPVAEGSVEAFAAQNVDQETHTGVDSAAELTDGRRSRSELSLNLETHPATL